MLRVALTGGIATGKSYCLSRFAALGVPTVDADALAREAVTAGSAGLRAIVERFGGAVLQPDGTLDRAAVARIVFADRVARADLEAIVHPEVYRRIREWYVALPPGPRFAIADIPLLFETGHQHHFDSIVVCACSRDEQVRRLTSRDKLSASEPQARLAAQWPIEEKVARGDHVIRTDGTFADTDLQIKRIHAMLNAE
jgi:dephospho-CoA kinase